MKTTNHNATTAYKHNVGPPGLTNLVENFTCRSGNLKLFRYGKLLLQKVLICCAWSSLTTCFLFRWLSRKPFYPSQSTSAPRIGMLRSVRRPRIASELHRQFCKGSRESVKNGSRDDLYSMRSQPHSKSTSTW